MKQIKILLCSMAVALCVGWSGCQSTLEPGGAYNPVTTNAVTNLDGHVTFEVVPVAAPQKVLYIADSSYKFAYETVMGVFKFERENRVAIFKISPKIKKALDEGRKQVLDIDQRWAKARAAYKANPTPAGLDTIHTILSEIQNILPIIEAELAPYLESLTQSKPSN